MAGTEASQPNREAEREALLDHFARTRLEHLVDASQPLVLIAQPNRSGGTLLSQLFDSHPAVHSHPAELLIGDTWPTLDLTEHPKAWFKALAERHLGRSFQEGYWKDKPARELGRHEQVQSLPFLLPPALHRQLFLKLTREWPCTTQRDVLDRYFTSLFNAWLDNQNLYAGPKRWTVVFRGRLRTQLEEFFTDYPDGRHITCVRDAKGIIASQFTRKEQENKGRFNGPIKNWIEAVESRLEARERYGPERVFILTFAQLLTEPEATMRAVADWLGISYDPILTEPTFNRLPIRANSSFEVERAGLITAPLENWRKILSQEDADAIDGKTRELYERVLEVAPQTGAAATAAR